MVYDITELLEAKKEQESFLEMKNRLDYLKQQLRFYQDNEGDLRNKVETKKQELEELSVKFNRGFFARLKYRKAFVDKSVEAQDALQTYQTAGSNFEETRQNIDSLEEQLKKAEEANRRYLTIYRRTLLEVKSLYLPVSIELQEIGDAIESCKEPIASIETVIGKIQPAIVTFAGLSESFTPMFPPMGLPYNEIANRVAVWHENYIINQKAAEAEIEELLSMVSSMTIPETKAIPWNQLGIGIQSIREALKKGENMPLDKWWKPSAVRPGCEEFDLLKVYPNTLVQALRNDTDLIATLLLEDSQALRVALSKREEECESLRKKEEQLLLNLNNSN